MRFREYTPQALRTARYVFARQDFNMIVHDSSLSPELMPDTTINAREVFGLDVGFCGAGFQG